MLWLVQADCGDYYCGCGGGHPLGVYSTEQLANEAAAAAAELTESYRDGTIPTWKAVYVEEITLDQIPTREADNYGALAGQPSR